ncbi:MAG: sulfotransferase domain-containing protein [Rhizomicrobium sp.]
MTNAETELASYFAKYEPAMVKLGAPHRPRTVEEMAEGARRTIPPEQIIASITGFRPNSTDVIIAPFAKCGTTWLQQTFYTLRTRGDTDFDDISRVVPWIETAGALGLDLDAPQRGFPRGFKSHLAYDRVPKGARYVVSFRDPKDALVSDYRFMEGWWFEKGAISFADFAQSRLDRRSTGRDYWHHLLSWWCERDNPEMLLFSYEHMRAEPAAHIRRLAAFCGIALDEALLRLTLERSSLAFMLAHREKFDDKLMRELSESRGGLPTGSESAKVRTGEIGAASREMPPETAATLDAVWREAITPKLGYHDYAAFEAAVRERTGGYPD